MTWPLWTLRGRRIRRHPRRPPPAAPNFSPPGGSARAKLQDLEGKHIEAVNRRRPWIIGRGVADLSRLARNARLMLDLSAELERRRVPLLIANMPNASFDGANGRYMFGQLALAGQLQRDLDSEGRTSGSDATRRS